MPEISSQQFGKSYSGGDAVRAAQASMFAARARQAGADETLSAAAGVAARYARKNTAQGGAPDRSLR